MAVWWIDEGKLLGSSNPSSQELQMLYNEGFNTIISFLDEEEQSRYDRELVREMGFELHSIPVPDCTPPSLDQYGMFWGIVIAAFERGKVVAHCEGGSGRTGSMGAAYWILKGLPAEDAIEKVRRERSSAVETSAQCSSLHELARQHACSQQND